MAPTSVRRKGRPPEELLWERTRALHARIKELSCLYQVSRLEREDLPLEDFLRGVAATLRVAWQHAEVAGARLTVAGESHGTANFGETPWMQRSDVFVGGERVGSVEVCYLEKRPQATEGPFLQEERYLIDAIAERVGSALERRQAEETLHATAERYRALFEQTLAPIVVVDGDTGELADFNDSACSSLGYTRAELARLTLGDIHVRGPLALRAGETIETELRTKDGQVRVVLAAVSELVLGQRHLLSILWRDITERVRMETALRVAKERLDGLLDALPDLLFEVDAQGRIRDVHTGSPELLYLSPQTFLGRVVAEVLPEDAARAVGHALDEAQRTGRSRGVTYALSLPGAGERRFELSVARAGDRLIALARDVTDRGTA